MENRPQPLAFEWSLDRFAGDLLPPRSGFFIAHDEVLIVDARQMEMKLPSVYRRLPHQTGVTECSISRHNRRPSHSVLNEMVISHLSNRISGGLAVAVDGHHDVGVADKGGFVCFHVTGVGERIEHPLEMVLSREP